MKNLTKSLLVVGIVAALGVVTGSAHAYYQPSRQSYGYSYNSYNYGYNQGAYYQPVQAQSYPVYNYPQNQNLVGGLVQSTLNFTNSFTYVAPPIHQYFYQYYPSYNYGGYGYGYNY